MGAQANIGGSAITIGDTQLSYGVDKFTEEHNQYEAYVGGMRMRFEAQGDEEAIHKGNNLIIEAVKEAVESAKKEKPQP